MKVSKSGAEPTLRRPENLGDEDNQKAERTLSPLGGTESAIRHEARGAHRVEGRLPNCVAPPVQVEAALGILEDEEHKHHAHRDADVEAGGEDVVEAEPPAEVVPTHEPLEERADHRERGVADARRGRELREPGEADGDVDVAPDGHRVAAGEQVEGDGEERADEEEVEKGVVHRSRTKESSRTDTTREKCSSCERRRTRTDESVFLVRRTEIGDVGEHPFLYTNSYEYRNDCCSDLSEEHDPRWDFHVVT